MLELKTGWEGGLEEEPGEWQPPAAHAVIPRNLILVTDRCDKFHVQRYDT